MQEINRKRAFAIGLRARAPLVVRAGALLVLVAALVFVAISYYRLRNNTPFRLKSEAPELSKEITGIIEGYEQRMMKGDRLYLWIRAARDITFSDGHHELDQVQLSVYPSVGDKPDQISANKAIYDQANSVLTFQGSVKIETKDALKVNTESIAYNFATKDHEVAQTDAPVTFERENVSGHSTGAIVESQSKKLELKKDVQITVAPEALKDAKAKGSSRSRPVVIRAAHAVFLQEGQRLSFSGGVTTEQDRDLLSGDTLNAALSEKKQIQKVEIRGNSYLRTMQEGRSAEVRSADMDFYFDKDQQLEKGYAIRDASAKTLDADSDLNLTGASMIEVVFQAQGDRSLLKQMRVQGRAVITLAAPKSKANDPRAANKRLTADTVHLIWRMNGRDLDKADAVGNAELFVDPVVKNEKADTQTLTAPRIDCDFFETGNLARTFIASGGAKAVVEPVVKTQSRGTRVLTSQKMTAVFAKETQAIERTDAQGDAKFNENDRNGIANNISYTADDQTIRLRGGEPTVWDARARTKAIELDSNLASKISYSRGKTATTYYSQEQTNAAVPFSKVKSPVYIVSDRGEFHGDSGVAIYTGNARAWQDDNFVRGDKLTLYMNDKKMEANGRVQSQVYNSRRTSAGNTLVPVFATANYMTYSDVTRTLHYEGDVDIRQETDRVVGGVADVYLSRSTNEVEKTVAQRNVVLTQPNRKGTGDWVEYTAVSKVAVLKGNPAKVEDLEKGSTEGGRLTLNMVDGRVTADDVRGPQSPGRVRSVHKVRKP